jgi:hypothetical protein
MNWEDLVRGFQYWAVPQSGHSSAGWWYDAQGLSDARENAPTIHGPYNNGNTLTSSWSQYANVHDRRNHGALPADWVEGPSMPQGYLDMLGRLFGRN